MPRDSVASRARVLRGALERYNGIFPSRFRELRNGFARTLDAILGREGITQGQWRCLRVLSDNDGVSQRELAAELDMSSAATVFSVNLLERDGIAERVPDPNDKRRVFVTLTQKGHHLDDVLLAESRIIHKRIFSELSDRELVALDRLLAKLRRGQLRELERRPR